MAYDFSGYNIFISGAGRGLGRASAIYLAGLGATVAVSDLDETSVNETVAAILATDGKACGYVADLGVRAGFLGAAAEFAAACGPLHAMINNASILRYEPIEEVSEETVDLMVGGGLKTVLWGTQAMLAHMDASRGGSIINYASPVSFRGYPRTAVYSAVKGAVLALTRVMAAELGPRGVRVNALCPGSVPTPGAVAYVDRAEYERRAGTIPLRRLGRDEDITHAIAFLLGPDASFINGAVLNIDGGIVAAG
ncbi:SDR family NAD(P)-dependent oxidoreductase [Pseudoduganella dura]|nr:SDR family oxidoreductase [Pseudoduganella dura]GGX95769.1 oxidoreductase [Pseudoduganella dura]